MRFLSLKVISERNQFIQMKKQRIPKTGASSFVLLNNSSDFIYLFIFLASFMVASFDVSCSVVLYDGACWRYLDFTHYNCCFGNVSCFQS